MTDLVNPSPNRTADPYITAGAIANGGSSDGFVVDGSDPSNNASHEDLVDETTFNSFASTSSASSYDVTVDPGEAFVGGSWVARDTSTTVTLAASTTGQTVYAGWNATQPDGVIIGLDADFGVDDPRIPLHTFDTDGSGVTASTDDRTIGYSTHIEGEATFGSNEEYTVQYDSNNGQFLIQDQSGSQLAISSSAVSFEGNDINDGNTTIWDASNQYIPQGRLQNDSVIVAGNSVALGGSTDVEYLDLNISNGVVLPVGTDQWATQ